MDPPVKPEDDKTPLYGQTLFRIGWESIVPRGTNTAIIYSPLTMVK
jgi:hypothetical protein